MNNEFIFGSSPIECIVSSTVRDGRVTLYRENAEPISRPSTLWLLASEQLDSTWSPLDGSLHYRYIKTFSTQRELWDYKRSHPKADFYQVYDEREQAATLGGFTYFKGLKFEDVSVLAFDIESTSLEHGPDAHVLLISNTFKRGSHVERKLFAIEDYETEAGLFRAWSQYVQETNPSIMVGHNIFGYDLPYLDYCARRAGVALALGRNGEPLSFNSYESKYRRDGSQFYTFHNAQVAGRELVDTFFLSMKYDVARKYSSYALKTIIREEKLEVADRQHYDGASIARNYHDPVERAKIKAYALHDADDALALWSLMGPAYFYLARSIPKALQQIVNTASGSWLNSFLVRSYLQVNHSIPKATEAAEYEGAISLGNPGVYRNVFKVDVASLYPSIMLEYDIHDSNKDPLNHFGKMVSFFTSERLNNKAEAKRTGDRYYKDLSEAQKVVINSAYGMLGAPGLSFNSPPNAALVTQRGREILTRAMDWAKDMNMTVVNADTDSISITNPGASWSDDSKRVVMSELNSISPARIRWEDDGTYNQVLVIKTKNYVLERDGKRKVKGSALKATLKSPALREFINDMVTGLFDGTPLTVIYEHYVNEILNLLDINRWAFKKTITEAVASSTRTNEAKVRDALEDTNVQQGDKVYLYFAADDSLKLVSDWNGDHNVKRLLKNLHDTVKVFDTVCDVTQFPNYTLKRNQSRLLRAS